MHGWGTPGACSGCISQCPAVTHDTSRLADARDGTHRAPHDTGWLAINYGHTCTRAAASRLARRMSLAHAAAAQRTTGAIAASA
jgi:hypothetical protein